MNKISAVILTKNSQRLLKEVLESLVKLDEVVILDNGSNDETINIAKSFQNTSIHYNDFIGFGELKALGSRLAKNDWILTIDSDEIASSTLIDEILNLNLKNDTCYSYDVKNYFNDKHIYSCGWGDDRCIGLYNKEYYEFNDAKVHERIIPLKNTQKTIALKGHISHYPYENIESFLDKMQKYSTLYANGNKHKKSSITKALTHSIWAFIKSYLLKKGFLQGYEGFIISVYNSQCSFWKYIKLYEVKCENTNN
ncbi:MULTISPECIES: glycosyltransferase family 2 protein [Helicobacter]|uniref:Glycosyltransferase family 2 protein n=1 Tax=Helicobacter ibis TaxID=2962633 RepID=A0ABT4VCM7_9HELI|nr:MULTISPECIES: glycosyltransferase family 2 protein [Helicobacter]MDA3966756.1 glycosyltransferase family 2 protein [Helicobacter sp. WB40]MDA3968462.1 glycosyltransferase family 2 protein [Helicobacter ibis]